MKALNFIPALILVLVTINSDLFQKKFWTEQGSLEKNQSTYFGVEKKQEKMRKKSKEEIGNRPPNPPTLGGFHESTFYIRHRTAI